MPLHNELLWLHYPKPIEYRQAVFAFRCVHDIETGSDRPLDRLRYWGRNEICRQYIGDFRNTRQRLLNWEAYQVFFWKHRNTHGLTPSYLSDELHRAPDVDSRQPEVDNDSDTDHCMSKHNTNGDRVFQYLWRFQVENFIQIYNMQIDNGDDRTQEGTILLLTQRVFRSRHVFVVLRIPQHVD